MERLEKQRSQLNEQGLKIWFSIIVVRSLRDELHRLLLPSWSIAQVIKVVKMDGKNKAIVKVLSFFS